MVVCMQIVTWVEFAVEVQKSNLQLYLDVKQEHNDDSLILRFTFYIIKYVRLFTL